MSSGKLKITSGDLTFELEGDNELLYRSFSDMRLDGSFSNNLSSSKQNINIVSEALNASIKDTGTELDFEAHPSVIETPADQIKSDLPDFNSLILERRTFSTSNWMLLMAWSVSHKGRIKFTKKQIRKIYSGSCKHIGLRSKDFISNFMLLLLNDYIVMTEKNTYELSETGYDQAYSLLSEPKDSVFFNQAI